MPLWVFYLWFISTTALFVIAVGVFELRKAIDRLTRELSADRAGGKSSAVL
jgi:hypothetical protein